LESIGKEYKITRERVRQIERDGFLGLKPELKKYQKVFVSFKDSLGKSGNLKREDLLLQEIGGNNFKNQINFLLNLGEGFERIGENNDFCSFWTVEKNSLNKAGEVINSLCRGLEKSAKPVQLKELINLAPKTKNVVSYIEISKRIQRNSEGLFGLSSWPEINPKGIKDKAYLVFKKEQKPLHFTQVAQLIDASLPQTVHNELIKDQRFVLVGRGLYALKEWGYKEGVVKDVIADILREAKSPLSRQEILTRTLKQRMVKENTVLLNLSDKKYFARTPDGNYTVHEV
jgi:hypothetical protein